MGFFSNTNTLIFPLKNWPSLKILLEYNIDPISHHNEKRKKIRLFGIK